MKRYNLFLLEKGQILGQVGVNNDFSKIKIDLEGEYKNRYEKVLGRLISTIKKDGNLKSNSGPLFWTALVQSLFLKMGILIDTRGI